LSFSSLLRRGVILCAPILLTFAVIELSTPTPAPASAPSFRAFEHRYCRGVHNQDRRAAPPLERFNRIFYEEERSPENLRLAGREFALVYKVWRDFSRRLFSMEAPIEIAGLWHKLGRQQWAVLRLGNQLVAALDAADLPRFQELNRRNIRLQIRRNKTWARSGLSC
jgi:hypothetical protein